MDENNLLLVGNKVEILLVKYFYNVRLITVELSNKEIKEIYYDLFFTLFNHDIDTIHCFNKIKEKKILGMDIVAVMKFHKFRIRNLINKYEDVLCSKDIKSDNIEIIIKNKEDINNIFIKTLEEIAVYTKEMNLKELVYIHRIIIRSILKPFNVDNESVEKVEERFLKLFGKHFGMLDCKK